VKAFALESPQLRTNIERSPRGSAGRPFVRNSSMARSSMTSDSALALISELLRMALVLTLPLMAVILVSGVLISIIQVVTQVQDPSIAFVPKLVIFGVVLALLAPWMLGKLTAYGIAMFARIAH
jgi:flagellar biosynthetic protein FliQ